MVKIKKESYRYWVKALLITAVIASLLWLVLSIVGEDAFMQGFNVGYDACKNESIVFYSGPNLSGGTY